MSPVSAISLSGLNAAMLRIGAAASNIANMRSNGPLPGAASAAGHPPAYTPVQVAQSTAAGGGIEARIISSPAAPVEIYDPSAPYADARGMVASPDTDLAGEMLQLVTASNEFAANLLVMRIDAQMSATLFDMKV
jgi:flagellar basal-body rod protein FlgC